MDNDVATKAAPSQEYMDPYRNVAENAFPQDPHTVLCQKKSFIHHRPHST